MDFRSKAAGGVPICRPSCVTEPPCCAKIIQKMQELGGPDEILGLPDSEQPYHECEWTEGNDLTNDRAYCTHATCDKLPLGKAYRGGCAHYWGFIDSEPYGGTIGTNTSEGYGCMIGDSAETMVPICEYLKKPTPKPTSPIQPSKSPVPTKKLKPTKMPTPSSRPSQAPFPTNSSEITPNPLVTDPVTAGPEPTSSTPEFNDHALVISPQPGPSYGNPVASISRAFSYFITSLQDTGKASSTMIKELWDRVSVLTKTIAP